MKKKGKKKIKNMSLSRYNVRKSDILVKFRLKCAGFGEDCYRTWESVLLGAIPVVRESALAAAGVFQAAPVYVLKVNPTGSFLCVQKCTD